MLAYNPGFAAVCLSQGNRLSEFEMDFWIKVLWDDRTWLDGATGPIFKNIIWAHGQRPYGQARWESNCALHLVNSLRALAIFRPLRECSVNMCTLAVYFASKILTTMGKQCQGCSSLRAATCVVKYIVQVDLAFGALLGPLMARGICGLLRECQASCPRTGRTK